MSFLAPFEALGEHLRALLPNLVAMFVILLVGIVVSVVLRRILVSLLEKMRFDDLAFKAGFAEVLFKANIPQRPSRFLANLVYGVALMLSLVLALSTVNFEATSSMLASVARFIPNMIVALIVIGAGHLLSKFAGRSVLLTAVNAEIPGARLIAYAVQTLIMLFAVAVGLEQIGLAQTTIIAAFSILFGGLVLAVSIAFGLGGRDLARAFLERHMRRGDQDPYSERPFSHL